MYDEEDVGNGADTGASHPPATAVATIAACTDAGAADEKEGEEEEEKDRGVKRRAHDSEKAFGKSVVVSQESGAPYGRYSSRVFCGRDVRCTGAVRAMSVPADATPSAACREMAAAMDAEFPAALAILHLTRNAAIDNLIASRVINGGLLGQLRGQALIEVKLC